MSEGHRPDQSRYLAHFTKPKGETLALDVLIKILSERKIIASSLPWTHNPAACFSECPWSSLLGHCLHYSPYGIGFEKPRVFAAGGGPAYYVRADHWEKQDWAEHVKTFVTPFWPSYTPKAKKSLHLSGKTVDYAHEREWRIPHDFEFKLEHISFVILDNYEDMAKFPKDLKDGIGRDKFLLMQNYRTIEELWPTHLI